MVQDFVYPLYLMAISPWYIIIIIYIYNSPQIPIVFPIVFPIPQIPTVFHGYFPYELEELQQVLSIVGDVSGRLEKVSGQIAGMGIEEPWGCE